MPTAVIRHTTTTDDGGLHSFVQLSCSEPLIKPGAYQELPTAKKGNSFFAAGGSSTRPREGTVEFDDLATAWEYVSTTLGYNLLIHNVDQVGYGNHTIIHTYIFTDQRESGALEGSAASPHIMAAVPPKTPGDPV